MELPIRPDGRRRDPFGRTARLQRAALALLGLSLVTGCAWIHPFRPDEPTPRPTPEPAPPALGAIRGQLIDGKGAPAQPVVVYLDPLDEAADLASGEAPTIHQRGGRFSPDFLAVAAGASVRFSNEDEIYHNVFSSSEPNAFDLGLLEQGDSRSVTLSHPGVVRLYSSLHEAIHAVIFVAPSPYFTTLRGSGSFEIRNVPAGSYRLGTWSERAPSLRRDVRIRPGESLAVELRMEESGAPE